MYITVELIKDCGACQSYLDFFSKHYPDGIEAMDAIKKAKMPYHAYALHWGYSRFNHTEEEAKAYWEKVKVINSKGVSFSYDVIDSSIISNSNYIESCEAVYRSDHISHSSYILGSDNVYNSHYIGMSSFVESSERVMNSKNITDGRDVYASNYAVRAVSIFESNNIIDSHIIWKSENLTDCGFCFGCHNVKHALFCEGQADAEYLLFNKPIDQMRFEATHRQFARFLPPVHFTDEWKVWNGDLPRVYHDYRKHVVEVPSSFWQWVKTLPNYDPKVMYSLTFDPQFLR
jgi:hypothetical protein